MKSKKRDENISKELNAENLKAELWDTLLKLRNREIPPAVALAVAANSREIMRVVRAELLIAAATSSTPSRSMIGSKRIP